MSGHNVAYSTRTKKLCQHQFYDFFRAELQKLRRPGITLSRAFKSGTKYSAVQ